MRGSNDFERRSKHCLSAALLIPSQAMRLIDRILSARESKAIAACVLALAAFVAGSVTAARLVHLDNVRAGSNRVFELRVYHTLPGKASALESRFRDKITPLFAVHGLKPIGFWVPQDAPASGSTFIYILVHDSRDSARKNWDALFADPGFAEVMKDEKADKLVQSVDSTFMDPADFSPLK